MDRDERTARGGGNLFPVSSRHFISRLNPLLDRPVVLGLVAVFMSILCCGVLERNSTLSEVKSRHATAVVTSASHRSSARSEGVPVLFLTLLGLGALALSQTRPSSEIDSRPDHFAQAKKSSAGKSCPDVR